MRRLLDFLYDAAAWLAALAMIGVLLMVLLSIVSRQVGFHVPGTDAYAGYAMAAAGFPISNYLGHDGIYPRADLAGLNLAQFPSVLVELGNMKNPVDSGLMKTPEGRQKYAEAVVRGIAGFLGTQPAPTH